VSTPNLIDVASTKGAPLKLRIEGMDCAACTLKIENALSRLPGVSDIRVNYGLQTLTLQLDEDRTTRRAVTDQISALGYLPKPLDDADVRAAITRTREADERPGTVSRSWWQTRKGQLVLGIACGLAFAFTVSLAAPAYAQPAFVAAAVLGLIPFARRAALAAWSGTPFSIETLMSVAAAGAIVIGAAEEAAIVVFLFAVGELLETVATGQARAGIEVLMKLVPRVGRLERNGKTVEVPVDELSIGDVVLIRPGDRIPSDGQVIEGASEVDEAPVTGESVPAAKKVGSPVYAGSINTNGLLRVRVNRTAADNTIARIIHLVEEAQGSKAPTARFIDRFSVVYTPAAMAGSALLMVVPPLLFGADWITWIYRGLATLLIACPCALVISTPAAIASGLAAGARRGLLVKGGAALETLGRVGVVAFDKTGTITVGRPEVTDVIAVEAGETDILACAASVEQASNHPLGSAIVRAALAGGIAIPPTLEGVIVIPGKAVTARLSEGKITVGSSRYAAELGTLSHDISSRLRRLEDEGMTAVVVLRDERVIGLIGLRDRPRHDARTGIDWLKSLGIRTVMLTGDSRRTARAVTDEVGIEAQAELLPDGKLAVIDNLLRSSEVAMVGDGINDAPGLAAASVGVAMGGGTDVALETADAALLKNRVSGIAELVLLSRATLRNIRQNVALALGLKLVFLVTTLSGVTFLWMAILADTGATVLVTLNALRLLRFRPKPPAPIPH
jgi:Zn2+/Cd2+-exporting ATPase